MEIKELLSPPVIWFIVGAVLLLLELAIPGLILIFFGIGAWFVALLLVMFDMSLTWQLLIFIVTSAAGLALLRRFLKNKFFDQKTDKELSPDDEFTGKTGIAETNLEPGKQGKVNFRGTLWTAISDVKIEKGSSVKIIDKESITLKVTSV